MAWARQAEEAEAQEAGAGPRLSEDDARIALEFQLEGDDVEDETPDDPDSDAAERKRA